MSNDIFSLDIETKSLVEGQSQMALEPFRLVQGKARITDISISGPNDFKLIIKDPTADQVAQLLKDYAGKVVYMHYGTFDISWLYAILAAEGRGDEAVRLLSKIDIRDTMLLAKWLLNSQSEQFKSKARRDEEGGYDLKSLVKRFLPIDTVGLQEFLSMKDEAPEAGEDPEYWTRRAMEDTHFTRLLAIKLQEALPKAQRNGFLISQKQLPYVARSWVDGAEFNWAYIQELVPKVEAAKHTLAAKLDIHASVIQSPAQLGNLMFNEWGLTPINVSAKTGKGSTAKDDLKMIALRAQGTPIQDKMKLIMDFKKLQTLQTKYLNGFERVHSYIGEAKCHGAPKVFGTYTGRYTYSSKTKRLQKYQISIAMHQLPKAGPAKACMLPPEGYKVGKYDASGQEMAFMAWASKDMNMLSVLNQGMNLHSWMSTNITGEGYASFLNRLGSKDKDAYNTRQAAKLLNLSCQYRIGWKAIQAKFFGTYDIIISQQQSNDYLGIYKGSYPGVVSYWKDTCVKAMEKGYAETIAGRRYGLDDWQSHRWGTESSAINTPVQGSGADQKDLIIWLVSEQFPEVKFSLDIHDEGVFFLPKDNAEQLNKDIVHFLNNIDYEKYWDCEVSMPLNFEGQLGDNFKDCEEYAQPYADIVKMRKSSKRRSLL